MTSDQAPGPALRERLRRARRLLVIGCVTPAVLSALAATLVFGVFGDDEEDLTQLSSVLFVLLMIGLIVKLTHELANRPYWWPKLAAGSGGCGGVFLARAIAAQISGRYPDETAFSWLYVLTIGVGALFGWMLGRRALAIVVTASGAEPADTSPELRFRVRGSRRLWLRIGQDTVRIGRASCRIDSISWVGELPIGVPRQLTLPGPRAQRLTVTPGPGVRLVVPEGGWTVPTDQPAAVVEAIRSRIVTHRAHPKDRGRRARPNRKALLRTPLSTDFLPR